jgi:hypothetical protein
MEFLRGELIATCQLPAFVWHLPRKFDNIRGTGARYGLPTLAKEGQTKIGKLSTQWHA